MDFYILLILIVCIIFALIMAPKIAALGIITGGLSSLERKDILFKSLPQDILKKIRVNQAISPIKDHRFSKYILDNPEIEELEKLVLSGCIKKPSVYDQGRKEKRNGFNVIVFSPGMNLYKAFQGFLTEKQITKYARDNPDMPSWFGGKYLCYFIVRADWGSIIAYKVIKELVLIDYYNAENMEKIIKDSETVEFPPQLTREKFLNKLKISSGYKVTEAEQILSINENYKWDRIWYYTETQIPNETYLYCNAEEYEGFNPTKVVKNSYTNDIYLFKLIINHYPEIDGIICRQMRSSVEAYGVSMLEELVIKSSSQINKMAIDMDNPLSWFNWKIKDLIIPPEGIAIKYLARNFSMDEKISSNAEFALVRFYLHNNVDPEIPHVSSPSLFSYNLHDFANLNSEISDAENINNLNNLIKKIKDNVDILVFPEVASSNLYKLFVQHLNTNGYLHVISALNGSDKGFHKFKQFITVASKYKYTHKIIDSSSNDKYELPIPEIKDRELILSTSNKHRNQIIIDTKYGRIACIHLEIGIRHMHLGDRINKKIADVNSRMRITHLKRILEHKPDIMVGDFNFTKDDPECEFLKSNGFNLTPTANDPELKLKSTPYNRVDNVFTKIPVGKQYIIKCNYSDHLPILQELNLITK